MEDLKFTKIGSNMLLIQYQLLKIHPVRVVLTHSSMSNNVSTSKILFYKILKSCMKSKGYQKPLRSANIHNNCTEFTLVQHFFRSSTMCDDVLSRSFVLLYDVFTKDRNKSPKSR
jgi:hypothetical protein